MKIWDLFGKETSKRIRKVKATEPREPKSYPVQDREVKRRNRFEKEVFSYFFEHKKELGIDEIYSFENMSVDGALKLENGKVIALEIKHSLNWMRICNARVQIQILLNDPKMQGHFDKCISRDLDGALVVFKDFSADWNRQWSNRKNKKGWYHFYEEENLVGIPKVPVRIVRLTKEGLECGILSKEA